MYIHIILAKDKSAYLFEIFDASYTNWLGFNSKNESSQFIKRITLTEERYRICCLDSKYLNNIYNQNEYYWCTYTCSKDSGRNAKKSGTKPYLLVKTWARFIASAYCRRVTFQTIFSLLFCCRSYLCDAWCVRNFLLPKPKSTLVINPHVIQLCLYLEKSMHLFFLWIALVLIAYGEFAYYTKYYFKLFECWKLSNFYEKIWWIVSLSI